MNQTFTSTLNYNHVGLHKTRRRENLVLEKARALTAKEVDELKEKEYMTPEELRLLLYRVVDDEYSLP